MDNQTIDKERLTVFTNAYKDMIAVNEQSYQTSFAWGRSKIRERIKEYTPEEVEKVIESGNIDAQIRLSRNYYGLDGFYKRILLHYATILKYTGLLIPNPSFGKDLSEQYIQKKYWGAMDFLDSNDIPSLCEHITFRALRDGCYYGILLPADKKRIVLLDLPTIYCTSRFKDKMGNDIIEFDVTYFDTIFDTEARKGALRVYPNIISNWYRRYKNGKVKSKWVYVPAEIGVCLPFLDGKPSFLNVIPAVMEYEKAKETDRERDLEEIRKIIVQKIPHLQDGGLLFEPDEAAEIHKGTVKMMKSNPNVSVLTTYADVDAIVSKTTNDSTTASLQAALDNIYSESGTSSNLFGTDSNLALETSLNNDLALMMTFAHKLERFITYIINENYSNSNISFKYTILPITYYNVSKYIDTTFKLAQSGYSYLLPALASGFSQKEFTNIKDLENKLLKLEDKLVPLHSSHTESGNKTGQVGRPKKSLEDMSDKTAANQESLDRGGSSTNGGE